MRVGLIVTAAIALVGSLIPLGGAQHFPDTDSHIHVKYYLKAATSTTDPHLTLDGVNPTTDSYVIMGAAASATQAAASAQGQSGNEPAIFAAKNPLSSPQWLNITHGRFIYVFLYVQPTGANAGAGLPTGGTVRVELYSGTRFAGGGEFHLAASSYPNPSYWPIAYYYVFPEVASFLPGETLSLKVFADAGLGELAIGTNGGHQSYFEYGYFDRDPLAGALYVDHGKLVVSDTGGASGSPGALLLLAVPAAGLALGRRPTRRSIALLLVLCFAASGCLGNKAGPAGPNGATGTGGPTNSVEVHKEKNETLEKQGVGAIQGFVRDGETLLPLRDASAALVATSLSTRTDVKGFFEFPNVTAKKYLMRVDSKGFNAEEREILVEVGIRLTLNFTLVSGVEKPANDKAHVHDLWPEGVTDMELFSVDAPVSTYPSDTSATGKAFAGALNSMGATVPVPDGVIVLPGTVRIEFKVSWASEPGRPLQQVGMQVIPPIGSAGHTMNYVARAKEQPINVVFFPNEADSGHQKFTRWNFYLIFPQVANNGALYGEAAYFASSVHVVARVYKGIVPYEPAHEDFWKGAKDMELMNGPLYANGATSSTTKPYSLTGTYPRSGSGAVPQNKFVNPGTKEIRGNFSWTYTTPPPEGTPGTKWVLAYMPANVNPSTNAWKYATMTRGADWVHYTFVIVLEKGEADQFYQSRSYWQFSMDTHEDDDLEPNAQYSLSGPGMPQFHIDAKVFCCAEWEE